MKTFTTIFMVLAIVAGFILAITPFVAEKLLPMPKDVVRVAKPEAAAIALKQWFNSPGALFTDVQALNKSTNNKRTSWFSFSVGRRPIEKYIIDKKLQQTELDNNHLKTVFFTESRPASWWQPEAIAQETFFTGEDQGRKVSLMYNPDSKRGVLVTTNINKQIN
ncbi:MAG TPA: hypothetical protein EYH20_05705 [Leucothrix sp.]|nr:hypothetical protein [Leucothrix sp.]